MSRLALSLWRTGSIFLLGILTNSSRYSGFCPVLSCPPDTLRYRASWFPRAMPSLTSFLHFAVYKGSEGELTAEFWCWRDCWLGLSTCHLYQVSGDEFLIEFRSRKWRVFDQFIHFPPTREYDCSTQLVSLSARSLSHQAWPQLLPSLGSCKGFFPLNSLCSVLSLNVLFWISRV